MTRCKMPPKKPTVTSECRNRPRAVGRHPQRGGRTRPNRGGSGAGVLENRSFESSGSSENPEETFSKGFLRRASGSAPTGRKAARGIPRAAFSVLFFILQSQQSSLLFFVILRGDPSQLLEAVQLIQGLGQYGCPSGCGICGLCAPEKT